MSNSDNKSPLQNAGLDTLAIRGGISRSHEQEHAEALFLTSSYVFDNAQQAAETFAGDREGNVYSRYTNPTVRVFEERIAAMEGAQEGIGTASGMAAILCTCMALFNAGDHIICSKDVFGATISLFTKHLSRFGLEVSYVGLDDMDGWRAAIQPNTRGLFIESPSNPRAVVGDIRALAELAHKHEALLLVDNCFCTPALQKPIELGADIVIHSATKYIDGQGRALGGAVVGGKEHIDAVRMFIRAAGPYMSPFNAWVFLKGLETLRLRVEAHSAGAMALAQWLNQHPKVAKVYYAGLPDHPGHELAKAQQKAFGGVVAFEIHGGREQAWKVIDNTQLLSLTANLGDAKTTIVHPATTTHGSLTDEQREQAGIRDSLIRVAVGLENIEDIKADLERGFSAI
ncbi:MAG: O-succinylhomoserine sulfhydrylase [Porticoccaceae bacterium]|nr:O-succinylhomoserine sulfhydrylase [Porticoccaceae bacterium]